MFTYYLKMPNIPYDIYESDQEIVVVVPLWGVKPESIDVYLEKNVLKINWTRTKPALKENLVPQKEDCYWGDFTAEIQLPLTVYFDKIQPQLTKENILLVTVPKYSLPEKMKLDVKYL